MTEILVAPEDRPRAPRSASVSATPPRSYWLHRARRRLLWALCQPLDTREKVVSIPEEGRQSEADLTDEFRKSIVLNSNPPFASRRSPCYWARLDCVQLRKLRCLAFKSRTNSSYGGTQIGPSPYRSPCVSSQRSGADGAPTSHWPSW